jgi:hypothetical protein
MVGRVREHANVLLGLELRERGTRVERVRDGGVEVLDLDVEVQHHLLPLALGGPRGSLVELLELEGQPGACLGWPQGDPCGVVVHDGPAQELLVEARERPWVRGVEHGRGERRRWSLHVAPTGRMDVTRSSVCRATAVPSGLHGGVQAADGGTAAAVVEFGAVSDTSLRGRERPEPGRLRLHLAGDGQVQPSVR